MMTSLIAPQNEILSLTKVQLLGIRRFFRNQIPDSGNDYAYFILDPALRITDCDGPALSKLGYNPAQLQGALFCDGLYPQDSLSFSSARSKLDEEGEQLRRVGFYQTAAILYSKKFQEGLARKREPFVSYRNYKLSLRALKENSSALGFTIGIKMEDREYQLGLESSVKPIEINVSNISNKYLEETIRRLTELTKRTQLDLRDFGRHKKRIPPVLMPEIGKAFGKDLITILGTKDLLPGDYGAIRDMAFTRSLMPTNEEKQSGKTPLPYESIGLFSTTFTYLTAEGKTTWDEQPGV